MRSLGSALGHSMGSFPGYSDKFSSFMPQKRCILCYSLIIFAFCFLLKFLHGFSGFQRGFKGSERGVQKVYFLHARQ